jgi:signal transduction histidine kinase
LRGIRRHCDDLLACSSAAVVAHAPVSAIKDAAGRAIALTGRLALFNHRDTLKRSALDANAVVVGLAPILGRLIGKDVAVRIELAAEPLYVSADAATIEQVLLDLAVNSRDVMPGGGELLIETAAVERAGPPSGGPPTLFVRLAVTDTGADVSPGVRADIFEPFFISEHTPGTPQLGLATLDTVVQRHEGWLELERAREGTTFAVYLPRLAAGFDPGSDEDVT